MSHVGSLLSRCLWLFLLGGGLGVIIESVWWRLRYGFWQAHYTLLWLPLCTVYGFGAIGCYLVAGVVYGQSRLFQFFAYAFAGAVIEFVGGFLLDVGLKMRAWDYRETFLNIRGYVNGLMALFWGFLGLGFAYLVPGLNDLFTLVDGSVSGYDFGGCSGFTARCACHLCMPGAVEQTSSGRGSKHRVGAFD